ncbi:DUF5362 family protein [Marivirga sp.]|uniref:DUF5362 family protein n=1 Tax=Marivirga sp. TaxID=2018662 RepID=UPI002D7F1A13|nr:DUF5362 family protein [Marivirga sp.]HET8858383.1 DUF5362 family protein [Marivirga sp.]
MDNQNTPSGDSQTNNNELVISEQSRKYLNETETWTKFLSIVGFVFVGIIVIVALFAGTMISSIPFGTENNLGKGMSFLISGLYFLMAAVYFFPIWYLFKFSKSIKEAIRYKNNEELEMAFSNQKSFYKFIGIFTVVVLVIYGFGLLIALMGIL